MHPLPIVLIAASVVLRVGFHLVRTHRREAHDDRTSRDR